MSDDNFLIQLVQERFADTQAHLRANQEAIENLQEQTEHAGETDGFRFYAFADLPFAVDGMAEVRFAWVSDGRDIGEGAGSGRGVLCVYKPFYDEWRVVGTNVAVTV